MKIKGALLRLMGIVVSVAGAYWLAQSYDRARRACPPFRKRIYTDSEELIEDLRALWSDPAGLRSLRENPKIGFPLADKLMLTMVGAQGDRQAGSAQKRYALRRGLSESEIDSLLRGTLDQATVDEAPALVCARQYAEQRGQLDPDMMQRMVAVYGPRTAQDLFLYMRLVSLGSLIGNTIDALWSRILGQPAIGSSVRDELRVLVIFVFGFLPLTPLLAMRAMGCCSGEPEA